jgi:hypothetical protein
MFGPEDFFYLVNGIEGFWWFEFLLFVILSELTVLCVMVVYLQRGF